MSGINFDLKYCANKTIDQRYEKGFVIGRCALHGRFHVLQQDG
jgi:hypothetical protein